MFADVSGFTAMSEALRATGREGSETLTAVLNGYFEVMIGLVHEYGGTVAKFGGDAITVLFDIDDPDETALRAIECAQRMQGCMDRFVGIETPAGRFDLGMKVGIAAGDVLTFVVGTEERLEVIVTGPALDGCADAEHRASTGEIVCDVQVSGTATPRPLRPIRGDHPEGPAFLPAAVAARIGHGRAAFVNEHRRVTTVFVRFFETDIDDPAAIERVGTWLQQVLNIVQRWGGTLNKVDMGDKGAKLIVLFGAPTAHENDLERALRCAVDLQELEPVRIGVNTGFVFCGEVGSAARREYTVMGDAVNMAARLMQKAELGQTLSTRVLNGVDSVFVGPVQMKGKAKPVDVHRVVGVRRTRYQRVPYALPMVGRGQELAAIEVLLDRAAEGRGSVVRIVGEAGMGKSRLAGAVVDAATDRGFDIHGGACTSHGQAIPFEAIRDPWTDLLGDVDARLNSYGWPDRKPLLAGLLGQSWPDNPMTASLTTQGRWLSMEEVLRRALTEAGGRRIIVVEDIHWIDPRSLQLLQSMARWVARLPVVLLVVQRPTDSELLDGDAFTLGPFRRDETAQLIRMKLDDADDALIDRLAERSGGNPFYVDELLNYMADAGGDLASMELPGSLHSLVVSRLDTLDDSESIVLKVASVVGRRFTMVDLLNYYPDVGTVWELSSSLRHLEGLDITPLELTSYFFKHAVTHEVAYTSLAVSMRRDLHSRYAQWLERSGNDDPYVRAHHWSLTTELDEQRTWFARAAERARAAHDADTELNWLERLAAISDDPDVRVAMGRVLIKLGDWDRAERVLAVDTVAARVVLGIVSMHRGDFDRADACLEAAGEPADVDLFLELLGARAQVRRMTGRPDEAAPFIERAMRLAQQTGRTKELGRLHRIRGTVEWARGRIDDAHRELVEAVRVAREIGDLNAEHVAMSNVGVVHYTRKEFRECLTWQSGAFELASRIGDHRSATITLGNLGTLFAAVGDVERALPCLAQPIRHFTDLGDERSLALALDAFAWVLWAMGRFVDAARVFEAAEPLFANIPREINLTHVDTYRALGQLDRALHFAHLTEHDGIVAAVEHMLGRTDDALARIDASEGEILFRAVCRMWVDGDESALREALADDLTSLNPRVFYARAGGTPPPFPVLGELPDGVDPDVSVDAILELI